MKDKISGILPKSGKKEKTPNIKARKELHPVVRILIISSWGALVAFAVCYALRKAGF